MHVDWPPVDGVASPAHPTASYVRYRRLWVLLRFRVGLVFNRKVVYRVLKQQRGCEHRVRQACRDHRLQQEFIASYTQEQNGVIERFFRSLKEEYVSQHTFQTFAEARWIICDWLQRYNQERPRQALGYRSPVRYRAQQATQVA